MNAAVHQQNRTVISNIKRIRILKGYSQEYIGMKMNLSQNTFSKLELGYMELSVARLLQIAQILEVDSNSLFEAPAPQHARVIKVQRILNQEFASPAIHRLVAPCPDGLAGLVSISA